MDLSVEVHKLEQDLIKLKAQQGGAGGSIYAPIMDFTLKNNFVVSSSTNTGVVGFSYEIPDSPCPHTMVKMKSVRIDGVEKDFSSYTDYAYSSEGSSGISGHEITIKGVANGNHDFVMQGTFMSDLTGGLLTFTGQDTNGYTITLESE